jgi:hypothetical protein
MTIEKRLTAEAQRALRKAGEPTGDLAAPPHGHALTLRMPARLRGAAPTPFASPLPALGFLSALCDSAVIPLPDREGA